MTVKHKLILAFLVIALFVFEVGCVIFYSNHLVSKKLHEIHFENIVEMESSTQVAHLLQALKSNIRELILETQEVFASEDENDSHVKEILRARTAIKNAVSGLKTTTIKWEKVIRVAAIEDEDEDEETPYQGLTEQDELAEVIKLKQDIFEMSGSVEQFLTALGDVKDIKSWTPKQLDAFQDHFEESIEPITRVMQDEMSDLTKEAKHEMDLHFAEIEVQLDDAIWIGTVSVIVAFMVAISLGWITAVLISVPLAKLNSAARAIGEGKYDTKLEISTGDEIGALAGAFGKMAQSIQEQQRYVANMMSSIADTLLVISPEGIIKRVNRCELLGFSEDALTGSSIDRLFVAKFAFFSEQGFSDLIKVKTITNIDTTLITQSGTKIPVLVSGSVLGNATDGYSGVILIVKDITEYRRTMVQFQEQSWLVLNTAKFGGIVQKARTVETFAGSLITELTPFMDSTHGVMYVLNDETKRYHLMGSYGYLARKHVRNAFAPGESLVGQCARENKIISFEAPENYIKINSGLGEASPVMISTVPISFQGKVLAVIEIASFNRFTERHMTLLQELMPLIGLGLDNLLRTHRAEVLLQQTLIQAEQLESQKQQIPQTSINPEPHTQEL